MQENGSRVCDICLDEIKEGEAKAMFPLENRDYHIIKGCYELSKRVFFIVEVDRLQIRK